ncbi:MAG: hypothetical protein WKF92_13180 [Pyrinomonadaceae bacterium]
MPRKGSRLALIAVFAVILSALGFLIYYFAFYRHKGKIRQSFTRVTTLVSRHPQLIEPFGVAVKDDLTYISDGESGRILRLEASGQLIVFVENLHTPSAIAFEKNGDLIVADSGSHTIKRIDSSGAVSIVAGTDNQAGDADGDAAAAKFYGPVGVAVRDDGSIVVADTYNDKIKLIRDNRVTTLAGSTRGFADGAEAQFDTPCGVAVWNDGRILVADTENGRLRIVEPDGSVWTLAGTGEREIRDGFLFEAGFIHPTAIAADGFGGIYVADANAVRSIKPGSFPYVETITGTRRGFRDGFPHRSEFNRVSGLAIDSRQGLIIADSDNGAVRRFLAGSSDDSGKDANEYDLITNAKDTNPAEFRQRQPPRWPYDPPEAKRDVAGTLGEIRGELIDENSRVRFHNGFDIAGAYGETARFIRDEKVLLPAAIENVSTSRELIRMPSLGYIHIRIGRDKDDNFFPGSLFIAEFDARGKPKHLRIPRGTRFKAGDAIGTLNSMNHVHLIAGPSGDEMNAIGALDFPGISDGILPVIEKVTLFDGSWREIETETADKRIKLAGNIRVTVRAYDRMDGNAERRRLGVYRLGYQILRTDKSPVSEANWNISFDRNPDPDAVKFAYAKGSKSGATGETVFNYIVTNKVSGDEFSEGFIDSWALGIGSYILRVFAADFFGNTTSKDILIEVTQ